MLNRAIGAGSGFGLCRLDAQPDDVERRNGDDHSDDYLLGRICHRYRPPQLEYVQPDLPCEKRSAIGQKRHVAEGERRPLPTAGLALDNGNR